MESDSGSASDTDPKEALLTFLLEAQAKGQITAKFLGTLCFLCAAAGLEFLRGMATDPSSNSGNFQKRIDAYKTSQGLHTYTYVAAIPASIRRQGQLHREPFPLHTVPPHLAMAELPVGKILALKQALRAAIADGELPQGYFENKVVRESEDLVIPLALFVDGFQFHKKQTVLAMTVQPVIGELSGVRKLCIALRRKIVCRCSCTGWCSLHEVWAIMVWSFRALARGRWPETRHDNTPWPEGPDRERAGSPLPMTATILQVRCDWAELPHTFGLPSWSCNHHACPLCSATKREMWNFELADFQQTPWPVKNGDSYEQSCRAAEHVVEGLTRAHLEEVAAALEPDKRPQGSKGKVLGVPVAPLRLPAGLRIEPSQSLSDWALMLEAQPQKLTFWNTSPGPSCS